MDKKTLVYISDQKYYLAKDNNWYTTSSFPKELISTFSDLDEWIFLGRLYHTQDSERLHRLELNNERISIKFAGVWNSPPGVAGYAINILKYIKILRLNIKNANIIYLKFSFILSYLSGTLFSFNNKLSITHLVGDIDTIKLINNSLPIQLITKLQKFLYKKITKKTDIQLYVSKDLKHKYSPPNTNSYVMCENRIAKKHIKGENEICVRTNDEIFRIVYVGRLSPEKGLSDLLEAVSRTSNVHLTIIGAGSDEKNLRKIIHDRNINDRVRFLGYIKWGEKLFLELANYHSLVLPSYTEGLPLVILESMSIGLPVIASRVGGIPEIIDNYETGLLINKGDVDDLVRAINSFIIDESLRMRVAKAGLLVAHEYSLDNQLKVLSNILESIER